MNWRTAPVEGFLFPASVPAIVSNDVDRIYGICRMLSEWIIGIAAVILAIVAVLWWGASQIIRPRRAHPEQSSWLPSTDPRAYGIDRWKPLQVSTTDGLQLRGWILYPEVPPKGKVLLLHGISSCKEYMLPIACHFVRAGFAVVSFDARAQGESEGRYCTYGAKEVEDIRCILDAVSQNDPAAEFWAVVGHSLGGAIAVQALAREKRFHCGIIVGAFASLPEIVAHYCQRYYHLPFRRVSDLFLWLAGKRAGFDPFAIVPERAARSIQQPVMVIHGEADEDIPVEHGWRIYQALPSPHKVWYGIPGGGHFALESVAGPEYFIRQIHFLQQQWDHWRNGMLVSAQADTGSQHC